MTYIRMARFISYLLLGCYVVFVCLSLGGVVSNDTDMLLNFCLLFVFK